MYFEHLEEGDLVERGVNEGTNERKTRGKQDQVRKSQNSVWAQDLGCIKMGGERREHELMNGH
jgi:hypothetical protein